MGTIADGDDRAERPGYRHPKSLREHLEHQFHCHRRWRRLRTLVLVHRQHALHERDDRDHPDDSGRFTIPRGDYDYGNAEILPYSRALTEIRFLGRPVHRKGAEDAKKTG